MTMHTDEIEKLSTDLALRAAGLMVVDQASAKWATELVLAGKDAIKKIKAFFAPMKESAWIAHQEIVQKEKAELAKIEPVIGALSGRLSIWRAEEERKRRETEAAARRVEEEKKRLEEEALRRAREADEKAERERKLLEEEAEQLNKEAAKKANDEAALKRIDEEREKLRLRAEESRRIADDETTLAIDEAAAAEAALAPAPVVPEAPRTAGLAPRRYWKARVTNLSILVHSITNGLISIEAISPCTAYLNDLAGRLKDQVKIPGIEFYVEERMAEIGKRNKS
jgi:hypothetical protein